MLGQGAPAHPSISARHGTAMVNRLGRGGLLGGVSPWFPLCLSLHIPAGTGCSGRSLGCPPPCGTGVQRAAGCLYHILGWHKTSGLGRTRSSPGRAHTSPRTHTQPCTRRTRTGTRSSEHGEGIASSTRFAQRGRTHTHTRTEPCTHSQLYANARTHTHAHAPACKHTSMQMHAGARVPPQRSSRALLSLCKSSRTMQIPSPGPREPSGM